MLEPFQTLQISVRSTSAQRFGNEEQRLVDAVLNRTAKAARLECVPAPGTVRGACSTAFLGLPCLWFMEAPLFVLV